MSISVLIPTYDAERTIKRALDSVFAQSEKPVEVIVVDDGSTDNTTSVVSQYSGGEVRLFVQSNTGAAKARNKAASLANGEFYAFLDADDFWAPTKLGLQLEVFERYPEAGLCWCDFVRTSEKNLENVVAANRSALTKNIECYQAKRVAFEEIYQVPYLGTPNVMMRASVFDDLGGFDEHFDTAEDVDLWLRACYSAPAFQIPLALTYVVNQPRSLSKVQGKEIFANHLRVLDKFSHEHPEFRRDNPKLVKLAASLVREHWGSALLSSQFAGRAMRMLANSVRDNIRFRNTYLLLKALLLVVTLHDRETKDIV